MGRLLGGSVPEPLVFISEPRDGEGGGRAERRPLYAHLRVLGASTVDGASRRTASTEAGGVRG